RMQIKETYLHHRDFNCSEETGTPLAHDHAPEFFAAPESQARAIPSQAALRASRARKRAAHGRTGNLPGLVCRGLSRKLRAMNEAATHAENVRLAAAKITAALDRKSTRLNSSHVKISYAVFCLNK